MMGALRMKDLVEQTGTSRETIRFYINEGLLPQPRKTSRNSAWYGPDHIERLHYIRALQEQHFLPLKAIRAVLDGEAEQHFSSHQLHQFQVLRDRLRAQHAGEPRRRLDTVAAELGLTEEERQAALDMDMANADGTVGPQDEELLRTWVAVRAVGLTPQRGFSPRDLQIIQDAVDLLFGAELKLFTERLGGMDDAELGRVLDQIIPNVNRAFALLHQRKLNAFLEHIASAEARQGD